jgi:geranylgeranyl reductase family protein
MWDVIVVGTGPAGAMAAYELARNGCNTLLLEKEKLPRYKTCGGGLVERSWKALPFPISEIVERNIRRIRLTNNFRYPLLIQNDSPMVLMTMRSALDQYLTRKAMECGAELREGVRVERIAEKENGIECITATGDLSASFVIGADGVNSVVAKSFHWAPPTCGVALEVEVSLRSNGNYKDQLDFDFNVLPHGYGWVFPKSAHLSCGVFTLHRNFPEIRKFYEDYILKKEFANVIQDSKLSGHLIPLAPVSKQLHRNRCMLAGDAAGLADPLTGEGISFAIRSGLMAAKALLRSDFAGYSEEIAETLGKEIRLARILARILYRTPSFLYNVLARKEFFADSILDLFAGKTTYGELAKKVLLKPYKLI